MSTAVKNIALRREDKARIADNFAVLTRKLGMTKEWLAVNVANALAAFQEGKIPPKDVTRTAQEQAVTLVLTLIPGSTEELHRLLTDIGYADGLPENALLERHDQLEALKKYVNDGIAEATVMVEHVSQRAKGR